jgi:uncharacterized membrane protein YqgA involved in biofilm formation
MQIKKTLNGWLDRCFFVKEIKPRMIIVISTVIIGVVIGVSIDSALEAKVDELGRQAAKLVGFLTGLVACLGLLLLTSGLYNLCKRLGARRSRKPPPPSP